MSAGRVVVVGSANVDLVVAVDRHPGPGETVLGGDLRRTPGGKGANQAVAAARAGGADTTLVAAVGDDEAAALLLDSLSAAGVRIDAVQRVGAPTGTALITVSPDGENAIVVATGANALVAPAPPAWQRLAQADVVLAQLEIPVEVVQAAAAARRPGALFVLNAAPSRPLPDDLWAQVDVLVVNEHEAMDLAPGSPDVAVAAARLAERVPTVVVTLGAEGSLVARPGQWPAAVPAPRVRAVDTTGAGDTFCGVLAAGLAAGDDVLDAVRRAGVAGALAVTRAGAQAAVPSRAEVAAGVVGAP